MYPGLNLAIRHDNTHGMGGNLAEADFKKRSVKSSAAFSAGGGYNWLGLEKWGRQSQLEPGLLEGS